MYRIWNIVFSLIALFWSVCATAQNGGRTSREEYIREFAPLAVEAQEQYGIPASITLAQGILESDSGNSRLATEGNNHFGIKCKSNWTGGTVYHDDDEEDECFRAYDSAEDSYEDHSIFLYTGQRYASLFELDPTDYKGWAHGLRAAGYATNPAYAERLIKIIDDYELYKYDREASRRGRNSNAEEEREVEPFIAPPIKHRPPQEFYEWSDGLNIDSYTVTLAEVGGYGIFLNNSTRYIVAREGDSLKDLARATGVSKGRLRRLNGIKRGEDLTEGDIIYLEEKPDHYEGEQTLYRVAQGDTLNSISQRFGVSVAGLKQMNRAVLGGGEPYAGEELRLM